MFNGDDEDDDDHASTTSSSPDDNDDDDDDDVEMLLDRSRKLMVKAEDAECKCCLSRDEYRRPISGNGEKENGVDARNGDWKVKEWKMGDSGGKSSPPSPPPPVAAADDLHSCQSSTMSFDVSRSRRDPSSSSESREDLSLRDNKQRSSLCGSATGDKPSRCRGLQLDCAARHFNAASGEHRADVTRRVNGRCQQVAPFRPPPFRSFLSDVTVGSGRPPPVINIRKATVFISSRIGSNREEKKKEKTAKELFARRMNGQSDRPKTKTEIIPSASGSFDCHHHSRLLSLQSLELDGDSVGNDRLPRYPSPSSPSPSPCPPCPPRPPPPVSDGARVERAPEAKEGESSAGGKAPSSETSEGEEEKKKQKEKCGFKRMLDLTIVFLTIAVVLLAFFSYVLGPSKTKDGDPC